VIFSALFWNTLSLHSSLNVEEYYVNQMGPRVQHPRLDLSTVPVSLVILPLTKFTICYRGVAVVNSETR